MGQTQKMMCHKQEIAFEPTHDEWRPIDEWSEDLTQAHQCEPPRHCRHCCRPNESTVEEVLVVHHEALQKVDFLLKHDELTSCEAPAVPECVTAVRRAKILKRLITQQRSKGQRATEDATLGVDGLPVHTEVRQPCHDDSDEGDPSDDEEQREHMGLLQDFSAADGHEDGFEKRFSKGLCMWAISRGMEKEIVQEAVIIQVADWDSRVLRVIGEGFHSQYPLANVTCVEIASSVEHTPEEQNLYVYLTATADPSKVGELRHFAFQQAEDAQDLRRWMRTFYPTQVFSATDADPWPV